jgi:hypothetical protein
LVDPPLLRLSLTKTDPLCSLSCDGQIRATFSGGTAPLQLSIDGGGFTTHTSPYDFTGLCAGLHTVTVKDAHNCDSTLQITLVDPPLLRLSLTKTDPLCSLSCDGTITATFGGGTPPYMIKLDGGSFETWPSGHMFTSLCAGLHTVTVKDANNCDSSLSVTLVDPPQLTCTVSPTDTLICVGDSAHFCVFPAGGTPPYTYLWEGPNAFSSSESCMYAHDAGTYSVKVTDAHACTTRCDGILTTETCGQEYCGLTQGAYGNYGGNYFGKGTLELIQSLLADSALVVGKPGRSITITLASAECIIKRLPGGTKPDTLPAIGNDTLSWNSCQTSPPIPLMLNGNDPGRFANVLLAQTITLSLNLRVSTCDLGSFDLCEEIQTKEADYGDDGIPCTEDDEIMPGVDSISVKISASVLTALSNLGLSGDVNGLLELANRALAGWPRGDASLSQINNAVDAINRGFDECRFVTYCGPLLPVLSLYKEAVSMPTEFSLSQSYPNPFNPICVISYALPSDCQVKLVVYNLLGQRVKVLVDEHQNAGYKSVTWDGKDSQGQELASGIYFYRIEAGNFVQSKKMMLMK